jgi:hypothetical protein
MIKYVEILKTLEDGSQQVLCRFEINAEISQSKINTVGADNVRERYLDESRYIYGRLAKRYDIEKDGIDFLNNLKYQFSGSMIRASDVKTET